jgi:hypothetical protein
MRISSAGTETVQRTKRKSIFLRILEALHASRRREAKRVVRRYRHLMAQPSQVRTIASAPVPQSPEESSRNANGNKPPVHTDRRTQGARNEFA